MKIFGSIEYPPFIDEIAAKYGNLRMVSNNENREKNPQYDRGEKNLDVDILGAKCEMIGQVVCVTLGFVIVKTAPLIDRKPVAEPDIVVLPSYHGGPNICIDVKGVQSYSKDFWANVANCKKQKGKVTHYLFVQPLEGTHTARYISFEYDEVAKWEINDTKYDPAYVRKI